MQLTKFTDLSLRTLMYLTQDERAVPVTINEIAEQFYVPRNHLIKIVTRLNKLGWIEATRGRNGGLRLGVNALTLRLGDVIKELENSTSLVNCAEPPCVLKGQCNLKDMLDQGLQQFYNYMNSYTLADMVNSKTRPVVMGMHHEYQLQWRERQAV